MAHTDEQIAEKLARLLIPLSRDGTCAREIVDNLLCAACGIAIAAGLDSGTVIRRLQFHLDTALEVRATFFTGGRDAD